MASLESTQPSAPITTAARCRCWNFSLRKLFVLIAAIAIWLAWSANWMRQRRDFLEIDGVTDESRSRPIAPALMWLVGERGVEEVFIVDTRCASIAEAERLFPEATVTQSIANWMRLKKSAIGGDETKR